MIKSLPLYNNKFSHAYNFISSKIIGTVCHQIVKIVIMKKKMIELELIMPCIKTTVNPEIFA